MKIMLVLSRLPYPLEKGDKLRAYYQLKELSKIHEVILVCFHFGKIEQVYLDELKKYCTEIYIIKLNKVLTFFNLTKALIDSKPFQVHYFYQKRAFKKFRQIIEQTMPAHIYGQLIRTAEYLKPFSIIPTTFDYMDSFSLGMDRRISISSTIFKAIYKEEAKRLKIYEREVFSYFRNKTIISEQDKQAIHHPEKYAIQIVPNGVDFDFFTPVPKNKTHDFLFTGNMQYPPNVQCAIFLVKEVMPLIWKTKPNAKLMICGAEPVPAVKQLQSSRVTVTGWVDDIRDAYNSCEIFIAPMQIGSGLQNKLLEALAMNLPCITSSLANNALGASPESDILVGDTPEEIAQHAIYLLENENAKNEFRNNGFHYVKSYFSWQAHCQKLIDLIESLNFGTPIGNTSEKLHE